jgi:hypothetical protein
MQNFPFIDPDAIIQQETQGVKNLATTHLLPFQTSAFMPSKDKPLHSLEWIVLESWGVKPYRNSFGFVTHDANDALFTPCEMPDGWKQSVSDDDNRSLVLQDENGGHRAEIFYKAAFYDRYATLSINARYQASFFPANGSWRGYKREDGYVAVVIDKAKGSKEIYRSKEVFKDPLEWPRIGPSGLDAAKNAAVLWLDENRIGWKSYFSYWDNEVPRVLSGGYGEVMNAFGMNNKPEGIWQLPAGLSFLGKEEATLIGYLPDWSCEPADDVPCQAIMSGHMAQINVNNRPFAIIRSVDKFAHIEGV